MFHRGDCESRVIPATGGGTSDLSRDVSESLEGAFVRPHDIRPLFSRPMLYFLAKPAWPCTCVHLAEVCVQQYDLGEEGPFADDAGEYE